MMPAPGLVPRAVWGRVGLAWLGLLVLLALYWVQLGIAHRAQVADAEGDARLRASQTAHALAYQAESQFRHIDFVAHHVAEHWEGRDDPAFRRVIELARAGLPAGALVQIAVADGEGRIVFSSLTAPDEAGAAVSIADREHFRAHLGAGSPPLHVSAPVLGRVSGQWTVQFSRALRSAAGRLQAVIVLSVSVEHLASAFRGVFPDPSDVVLLVRQDGRYLTRNHGLEAALGKRVPAEREFLVYPERLQGVYEATAAVDGVTRYYAWQRIPGYPVILSLGLGKDKVLQPIEDVLEDSRAQNAGGSALLLMAALWITWLVLLKAVQNRNLLETREHLRQAVEAVRDGLWSWDVERGSLRWDARCHELLGYAEGRLPSAFEGWSELLHAHDRDRVRLALQRHARAGGEQVIRLECRLLGGDGHHHWVELRGRMLAQGADKGERRFVGTCTDIGARVAENQLRRALLDQSSAAILLVTPQRRIMHASARAQQVFAAAERPIVGEDTRVLHVDDGHFAAMEAHYLRLRDEGELRMEYPMRDAEGAVRWFDMHALLCDPDDPSSNVVWTLIDITERRAAELALEMQDLRLTTLLERFPAGVLLEDADGRIKMANRNSCRLLGLEQAPAALEGMAHAQLLERLSPARAAWLRLPGGGVDKRRMMEVSDEQGRTLEIDWVPIVRGEESLGHVWLLRDISERKTKERELALLASTDALTGLSNRRSFMAVFEERCAAAHQGPPSGALLMLDIDHFKRINDSHGHPVGDVVLQHVARVICGALRQEDHAGRLGGEEFAVVLHRTTPEQSCLLAERLRAAVAGSPARTEAGEVHVSISIGVVQLEGLDAQRALTVADQALYRAKAGGRNRVCVAD